MLSGSRSRVCALLAALALAAPAHAAPPGVPATLSYQGLLLDGTGHARTGNVDLTLRIFDALLSGTLVYKQTFSNVALADGVFSVSLGPTGDASDAPANPLTTSLATALAGDAGATAPARFLELTVGSEGALVRTQILSSAYALRAASAATADSATTAQNAVTAQSATTAQTATDVTNVGGIPAAFITQLWHNSNSDGVGPPNDDPREGLQDTDGDGLANFIDPDNDNDGVPDVQEIADGTDINLVSPRITGVTPNSAFFTDTLNVTVQGSGFLPGLTVQFGSQTPTATNVTTNSFQVQVGPQSSGAVNVAVANSNGEHWAKPQAFNFIDSISDGVPLGVNQTTLVAKPGTTIVALGGLKTYGVGSSAEAQFSLGSRDPNGQIAVAFAPNGAVAGLRCRDLGTTCTVEILVDSNGDKNLEDETGIPIETLSTPLNPSIISAKLAADPSGHWVAGYVRRDAAQPEVVVAHDLNGDGDFADPNELVTVVSGLGGLGVTGIVATALAVDSAGHVAYVYPTNTGPALRVAWDRNGDGDFADTIGGNPELSTLASVPTPTCIGATFDGSDRLAVVYGANSVTTLARDLNGDGDFADPGESVVIAGSSTACDVAFKPGQPLAVIHNAGGNIHLLLDKNGDGDFADAGEDLSGFNQTGAGESRLALNGVNRAVIAVQGFLLIAPTN